MTRGTTPTYILHFQDDFNMGDVSEFYVTLKQWGNIITKNDPIVDTENRTLTITLTQNETLCFKEGSADIQVRGKFTDGTAFASKIYKVQVNKVLYEKVI